MKIPLKYNLRSLWVRRTGTIMTAVGIGLTVAVLLTMAALVNGLLLTFVSTGHPNDVVVLRKSSVSETNSYFNRDLYPTLRFLEGVARDQNDRPWAVGELVVVINHPRINGEPSNVVIRGTSARGFELRPEVQLVAGRRFEKGVRELIVSRSLSQRFSDMKPGDTLTIASNDWKVVGVFDAGGTAYGSEIWGDYDEIALAWTRPMYTSVTLRARDNDAVQRIVQQVEDDRRLQLSAMPQKQYFAQQSISAGGITALGVFIAIVMGIGSCFAAMNMMFGTIMARSKEIGTLRSLGFRRRSILASFLVEAFLLAVAGGLAGWLLAIPVQAYAWFSGPLGSMNFLTFSEVVFNFRITPSILALGMAFSLIIGVVGGVLPAFRASRVRLLEVLRD